MISNVIIDTTDMPFCKALYNLHYLRGKFVWKVNVGQLSYGWQTLMSP